MDDVTSPISREPVNAGVSQLSDDAPLDAVLLVSFGGPEAPDEVVPFLENVTRGSGIPKERLATVGEHYFLFGGKSPINDQNRALIGALKAELAARGHELPIYWGNRNWRPYTADAVAELVADQRRNVAVVTTSAYPSYSGCRSYREDLAAALTSVDAAGVHLRRVGNYGLDDGFIAANANALRAAAEKLPDATVLFVTHSIPTLMAERSGPAGGAYVAWHRRVAASVARQAGVDPASELVYCSRSGRPGQPWLEPDVNDRLRELAGEGLKRVILAPIGFISDHMEVIYDLDTQARETCDELGIEMVRSATAGTDPAFVSTLVDRILGRSSGRLGECASGCAGPDCCPNVRKPDTPAIP